MPRARRERTPFFDAAPRTHPPACARPSAIPDSFFWRLLPAPARLQAGSCRSSRSGGAPGLVLSVADTRARVASGGNVPDISELINARERWVLAHRRLGWSYREIGQFLGVSPARASQIGRAAQKRLDTEAARHGDAALRRVLDQAVSERVLLVLYASILYAWAKPVVSVENTGN
jgi:hypothetical protein